MVKAIKVMLVPNNVQNSKMFQYAGVARFAYNWALAREKENYEKGNKFISDSELRKEFTRLRNSDEYAWLQNVSNNVTKQAIKDACAAYQNFFKGLQKYTKERSNEERENDFQPKINVFFHKVFKGLHKISTIVFKCIQKYSKERENKEREEMIFIKEKLIFRSL